MGRGDMSLTLKQHVDHWVSSSAESLLDMEAAINSKRRMNALYCGHLSVEKMFKALLAARDTQIIGTYSFCLDKGVKLK